MIEKLILGAVQGIVEWLPVSSEGVLVLMQTRLFGFKISYEQLVGEALFLHLGTFLAALVYFRRQVVSLVKKENKNLFWFLFLSTAVSAVLGFFLFKAAVGLESQFEATGRSLALIIGLLLLVTGSLQLKIKTNGTRKMKQVTLREALFLGIAQGLATLPGLSRSGITVAALLFSGLEKGQALRLSFLMSLPIVLGGNIVLNLNRFSWGGGDLLAVFVSFVFGLLTIRFLLQLAEKINFGYFVLLFGGLSLLSGLF